MKKVLTIFSFFLESKTNQTSNLYFDPINRDLVVHRRAIGIVFLIVDDNAKFNNEISNHMELSLAGCAIFRANKAVIYFLKGQRKETQKSF